MPWWLWIVLGFGLLVAEMVLPSDFFLFFFGLSAIVVGAVLGLGLDGPAWLPWVLFSVLSIAAVLTLRRPLRDRLAPGPSSNVGDRVVGERARLLADLPPGEVGQAELRGSVWRVRSRTEQTLPAGTQTRVERVEGLTLWVVAEEQSRGH